MLENRGGWGARCIVKTQVLQRSVEVWVRGEDYGHLLLKL